MKILIAPNSMKESLSAFQFADAVERAFKQCSPAFTTRKMPIADGGDFTGEILAKAFGAQKIAVQVENPYGRTIQSQIFVKDDLAVIEMADASGMKVCKRDQLNPLVASSFGTGKLIEAAIKLGCEKIYLGVGGSATVDAGMGMMTALNYTFFDENGKKLSGNGQNLNRVATIIPPTKQNKIEIIIVSDVDNPYSGENGAVEVFAPQKGATPEIIAKLEKGFKNWVNKLSVENKKLNIDLPGLGAAGGLALPLITFFDAQIVAGADFILDQLSIDRHLQWCDLVITGEGSVDTQTNNNKAPQALAKRAQKYNKPIIAIAGSVELQLRNSFNGMFSIINRPMSLQNAMQESEELVFGTAFELSKLFLKLKN